MSLSRTSITCTNCSFRGAYSLGDFHCVYKSLDGPDVNAPTGPGWCAKCKTISTIQCGLSPQQLNREILDLKLQIEDKKKRFIASKNDKNTIEWLIGEIAERQKLMAVLGNRSAVARCIACGSTEVLAIDIPLRPKGDELLPVTHSLCGGQFVAREGTRFFIQPQEKTLSLDHARPISPARARDADAAILPSPPFTFRLTGFQHFWVALFSIGPAVVLMMRSFWLGIGAYVAIVLLNGVIGWVGVATMPVDRLALFGYIKNAVVGSSVLVLAWALGL